MTDRIVTEYRNVRVRPDGRRFPWAPFCDAERVDEQREALLGNGIPAFEVETEMRLVSYGEWHRLDSVQKTTPQPRGELQNRVPE